MIPLSVPNISKNEWKYVKKCLDTGWVSSAGNFVSQFENAVCKFVGSANAVACVNGTSGLFIALQLLGVGPYDEVIVPVLTFIAPVNTVRYAGAQPIFMDCDKYMNIDVEKVEEFCRRECRMTQKGLKNKKTGKLIKAIIPVHIFGNPCNMENIMAVAKRYKLKVVEDATESLGAYYTKGKFSACFTGTIGDFGVYSFNGNKIITTGGGGMIVTNNNLLAKQALYISNQAKDDGVAYIHHYIGYNFRLTNLQAALGLAQFEQLKGFIQIKKNNYKLYKNFLDGVRGVDLLGTPNNTAPNYWFYSLVINKDEFGMDRNKVMKNLEAKGIQTRPIWYLNHLQRPYLKNQAYRIENAPRFWQQVLNLPCSTNLNLKQIKYITSAIRGLSVKNQ